MQVRNRATLRAVYCEPAFIYAVFLKIKLQRLLREPASLKCVACLHAGV